jgi:hypothetical protein
LSKLGLHERIAGDPNFGAWRAQQRTVTVDDRIFYLVDGDRLVDEDELMLRWAVEKNVIDSADVRAAQREIQAGDPPGDVDFID